MATKEDFEKALRSVEFLAKEYPGDARILTKWGIILVGCKPESAGGYGSNNLLQDGIEKLEEAIGIDPKRDDAMMWLGRAYTTKGLQTHDHEEANRCFDKAEEYSRKACELQPQNWEYNLCKEGPSRARRTHSALQKMESMAAARLSESSMSADATHFVTFGSILADADHGALESLSSSSSEPSSPPPKKGKKSSEKYGI